MRIETKSQAGALSFTPAGTLIAYTVDGTLHQFDKGTSITAHNTGLKGARCRISPDGSTAAFADGEHPIEFFAVATGRKLGQTPAPPVPVSGLGFSPDGKHVVYGTRDSMLQSWSIADNKLNWRIRAGIGEAGGIRFSPDGRSLMVTNMDANVRTHNPANGELTAINDTMPISHFDCVYSPDGTRIASAGAARQVHIFHAQGLKLERTFRREADPIGQLALSTNGEFLAAGLFQELSHRNPTYIVIYKFATGEVIHEITTRTSPVSMALSTRELAYALRGNGIEITSF